MYGPFATTTLRSPKPVRDCSLSRARTSSRIARGGDSIAIATPEAVAGDDLQRLETDVLADFRRQLNEEQAARTDAQRLYLAAVRQIVRLLRPRGAASIPTTVPMDQVGRFEP
jgi:hypothetical protein